MRRLSKPVARTARIDEQHVSARAGQLHGCREPGETAADDNRFVLHLRLHHVTFEVMYFDKLHEDTMSSDVTWLVA